MNERELRVHRILDMVDICDLCDRSLAEVSVRFSHTLDHIGIPGF